MGILDVPSYSKTQSDARYIRPTEQGRESLSFNKSWAMIPARAAFAKGNGDIILLGDSETEGRTASIITNRWATGFATDLHAKFNPSGITGGYGYVPAYYESTYGATPIVVWTYTGTTTHSQDAGLGRRCVSMTAGSSGSITFTGTSVKLFFTKKFTSNDAVSVTIDGGSASTVSIPSSGSSGVEIGGYAWTSGALTAGSHTVVVARTNGSPIFEGGYLFNTDESSGIRVWEAGHSGYLAWGYVNSQTAAPQWAPVISSIVPSMVVIAFGTNEYGTGGRTSAQFGSDLVNLIALVRANTTAKFSTLIMMMHERTPVAATPVEPYQNYVSQAYSVAAADTGGSGTGRSGVSVLDLSQRLPIGGTDEFGLLSDGVHYTDSGNQAVRQILTNFVTG